MTIENVTFGPVLVNGEWFARLRTPDGRSSVTGPFSSQGQAQDYVDDMWPELLRQLQEMERAGTLKIHGVAMVDGEAP